MNNTKQVKKVNSDDPISLLREFIEHYKRFLTNNNYHKRLCQAMKDIGRHYSDIIATEHSGDIKNIVGGFYSTFLKSLIHIIEPYSQDDDSENEFPDSDFFENLNEALEKFRNLFGNFLFDILRSDHAFFEMPSTAHPSIGSTTKLLLAYNKIINDWNNSIKSLNGHHRISFLVTSGGCDTTQAHNLLYKFEDKIPTVGNNKPDLRVPVIITIPEASLFDIKGTLFRLAHEFFHLKGNRAREERYKHYYKGLFYEYIDYCCNYIEANKDVKFDKRLVTISNENKDAVDSTPSDEHITISAINFKNYIETSTGRIKKNKNIKEYFALKNIFDEFNKLPDLDKQQLKYYKDYIEEAFDAAIFIHSDSYGAFKKELDNFLPNDEIVSKEIETNVKILNSSFKKNFEFNSCKKAIDSFNDKIYAQLDETFKRYKLGESNNKNYKPLLKTLNNIFELVPYNALNYASYTATYIPQLIGELSDIYAKVEYDKQKEVRQEITGRYGLIYNAYYSGKDKHNVFGFEEYPDDNGSGIKNLPSLVDVYARLWTRASIEFFLTDEQVGEFYIGLVNSFNMKGYEYLFGELYKECFADACALNSYRVSLINSREGVEVSNEELISFYISAFLYEHRNIGQFFSLFQASDLYFMLRFTVTIVCTTKMDNDNNLSFDGDIAASLIIKKIGSFLTHASEGNRELNIMQEYIKLILNRVKQFYNGSDDTNDGLKNYIYVQELITYVKDAMKKGNYVNYPQFTDNDYENVGIILDEWLGSYGKAVRKGKR